MAGGSSGRPFSQAQSAANQGDIAMLNDSPLEGERS